jgi:exopolysaccharide biosynthesis predicted pyruvyltransferase EpsI
MTKTAKTLINQLQMTIKTALDPHMKGVSSYALVDFPNHSNVGDSAIWLGELDFFRKEYRNIPAYVSENANFSAEELRQKVPNGPIFIHGGGNFGDLWPEHQDGREYLLQEFKDRAIIQLPQSIHYDSPANLKQSAEIINEHPNFTLLVRDHKSLAIAQANFTCNIELCPDMAFYMGALDKPVSSSRPLLLLLRTDKEKVIEATAKPVAYPTEDWLKEDPELNEKILSDKVDRVMTLGLGVLDRHKRRELFYRRLAEHRVARGVRQLSTAEFVITDRLHVHIISVLLGIPHIYLDNKYGKIGNFAEAWTQDCPFAHRADSLSEAMDLYYRLNSKSVEAPTKRFASATA